LSGVLSTLLRVAMLRHAKMGRTAITGPSGDVSYGDLRIMIDEIAHGAAKVCLNRGEPVGIVLPRSVSAIATLFGLMEAGACPCFIEPGLSVSELLMRMQVVGMRTLVRDGSAFPEEKVFLAAGIHIIWLSKLKENGILRQFELAPHDRALMLFTSGSTGQAKGVALSQNNLASNAEGVIKHTGITPSDRLLHLMPFYHTNGINNQLIAPFLAGASVILINRFIARDFGGLVRQYAPTYATGVPTIFSRVLNYIKSREGMESLRFLRCGAAPITETLHRRIEEVFGIPLLVSYGLSEATCTSTMNPPDARRIGTVGTVLSGQTVKVYVPGTLTEVTTGNEGEVCISGPSLMRGYLGVDQNQPIEKGWLHTGDLGHFDNDGYLTITGRLKDVIIRGGENISPQLIEGVLCKHPDVIACCVVGRSDIDLGEVPVAFIVVRQAISTEALRIHILDILPRRYTPAVFHFVTSLPENGVGKIDRRRLKDSLRPSPG